MHQTPPDLSETAPKTRAEWESLHTLSRTELEAMGCRMWDGNLCLFPYSWFKKIPEGFLVMSISGKTDCFSKKTSDDDYRGGMLAYGVVLSAGDKNE